MRMIKQLIFRIRGRGEDSLELDVIDQQVAREEQIVVAATFEARTIEAKLSEARHALAAEIADGEIEAEQARAIARVLIDCTRCAHGHSQRLEALT